MNSKSNGWSFLLLMLLGTTHANESDLQEDEKRQVAELRKQVELLQQRIKQLESDLEASRKAIDIRDLVDALRSYCRAEADFRANDRDINGANDFWVGDVSGLFRLRTRGKPLQLIDRGIAEADFSPALGKDLGDPLVEKPKPKNGYYFVVLNSFSENGVLQKYDNGSHRSSSSFGLAAFPAEYPKTGTLTYIVCEDELIYGKDTKGKAPTVYPDVRRENWTLVQ